MGFLQQVRSLAQRYVVVLLLGLLVAKLLINKYGGSLNSIPGPPLAGFTNLWRVFNTIFSNATETQIRLHRRHRSHFVRIAPRIVSVADPELIPVIYGVNSGFTKTEFYSIIDLWQEGKCQHALFESRDEAYHARILKPIAGAYNMSMLIDFEPAVDSTIELFISKMERFVASKESFNLNTWIQWYSFDVL